ncbi:MAG: beta-galactosidase, partial [Tepidisphaeraceae bacterium]
DNELAGDFDQSENTHRAFRDWLKRKYESIGQLNQRWGCQFWNTYYGTFEDIEMPADRELGYDNPHQLLDAQRFWSWAYADFARLQAKILKPRIGRRFITTNFMPFHLCCDPGDFSEDLSLFSWDSYPVTGMEKEPPDDQTYRIAEPRGIGFMHDLMSSYNGRWGLMEVQPGQINWSGVPVLVYPGAIRLWLWTAFAHGAEFITTYRYRQPRFGVELFHHGLVGPDGVTPSAGGREFKQVIEEIKRLPVSKSEIRTPKSEVGLLFDFDQLWEYQALPQAKRWNQAQHLLNWYGAIARLGLPVRIIHPDRDWPDDLKLIVAPGIQMFNNRLRTRLDEFASRGGNLILTCRTALMDRNGQLFEGPLAAPVLPMIGATIEAYDGLPEGAWGEVEMDGKKHRWGVWGDLLYAEPTTKVLAKYADQFYPDTSAITQRRHGSGTVTYCGVFAEPSLAGALVEKVARQIKLPVTVLPVRVHVLSRGNLRIALNYRDEPVELPVPAKTKFIIGSRHLEPAGVAVWAE